MQKLFTPILLVIFTVIAPASYGQYCMLAGRTCYSSDQPGITNFKLNTINRTSGNVENSQSVVVTTGLSTTLQRGKSYTISITHSEDVTNFPGARNNIRVWIDYNQNKKYTDANETVWSKNLAAPSNTDSFTFTVPATATLGTTSLRATAKMSADAGHSLPSPCDSPADPIGYHGEMEDYTVNIVAASGIDDIQTNELNFTVYPNPFSSVTNIYYELKEKSAVSVDIYNMLGEKVYGIIKNPLQAPGNYNYSFDMDIPVGIYIIKLSASDIVYTQQLVKSN